LLVVWTSLICHPENFIRTLSVDYDEISIFWDDF
jgi:hypothetical protein